MKELVGKTLYLTPTGNNARYHRDEVYEVELVKVSRVNVTIRWPRGTLKKLRKCCSGINKLDEGGNAGWMWYGSMQDLEDTKEINTITEYIRDSVSGYRFNPLNLGISKLRSIKRIIDGDEQVDSI